MKRDVTVNMINIEEKDPTSELIEHYSSWNSLKRAVAWILMLKQLLLEIAQKQKKIKSGLLQCHEKLLKERVAKQNVIFSTNVTVEPGSKKLVCCVLIKTKTSVQRPVNKVCLILETEE